MSSESKPLAITSVRVIPFDTRETGGKTVAYAEVEINGALLLKGIRVFESQKKGLFLGFPSQRAHSGRFVEVVKLLTAEARREMREAVIGEYKRQSGWEPSRKEQGEEE